MTAFGADDAFFDADENQIQEQHIRGAGMHASSTP